MKRMGLVGMCLLVGGHVSAAEAVDYHRQIAPIFKEACIKCHGPSKQKGRLRLDTAKGIAIGGAGGAIVNSEDPDESELLVRVNLPEGDDDVMPPKGHLSEAQIALLRQWIVEGAGVGDSSLARQSPEAWVLPRTVQDQLAEGLPDLHEKILTGLHEQGWMIEARSQSGRLLLVDAQQQEMTPDALSELAVIADHIETLDVSGQKLAEGWKVIPALKNARRVIVNRTDVTDAQLAQLIQRMPAIESLQVVGCSQITLQGLQSLVNCPTLTRVYIHGTAVTQEDLKGLEQSRIQWIR